jgi:ssDNA-binding Zn-finger/Zn-ribbon topoisomerase 1
MPKRNNMITYQCPECGSEEVTLTHEQIFMANTGDHYCHSVKVQDPESKSTCLECNWHGRHDQLIGYGDKE